ncbi:hypothetical protein NIIDMKKI_24780 [Mycobacterium kansasii]|uniref:Uncharacterized protein n=1 Tax=Mycobacterium kansasii TaxID=1768 RepID=A0A7G1IBM8_MYCKA|nr:hypothetical protein NIIDMKKI_24780 [Mycobacterium kansasii]
MGKHTHPEPVENSDQTLADSARADDAGALAVEVGAHKTVEREVPLPDADVGAVCLAVEGEQQRGGVFGDGLGRVRRHVHYADPQAARGFDVNVVVTGATHGNEAYPESRSASITAASSRSFTKGQTTSAPAARPMVSDVRRVSKKCRA